MLNILALIIIGGGAFILCVQDCKKQEISTGIYGSYLIFTSIYFLLQFHDELLIITYYVLNVATFITMSILLYYFYKRKAIALADIIMILIYSLIIPIDLYLKTLLATSLIGIFLAIISHKKHIGFVGIYALILFILALLISN